MLRSLPVAWQKGQTRTVGTTEKNSFQLCLLSVFVLTDVDLRTLSLFRLAYSSLHEASTALLPTGCPHCRGHLALNCAKAKPGDGTGVAVVPPPHCDICELSARVVMRGVGLMERDKDYDNAFHYLDILLQVMKWCCCFAAVWFAILASIHARVV